MGFARGAGARGNTFAADFRAIDITHSVIPAWISTGNHVSAAIVPPDQRQRITIQSTPLTARNAGFFVFSQARVRPLT
jgi:hypothetical protein